MTNTLNLTIAEPWFSKIASGEKLEEYREIKDYYRSRFFDGWDKVKAGGIYWYNEQFEQHPQFKNFDFLILRNGYQSNSPKLTRKSIIKNTSVVFQQQRCLTEMPQTQNLCWH